MDIENEDPRRTVIGGRYGSPQITVALPFANIVNTDVQLRDAIAELALLVARVAAPETDDAERELVRVAATELAERFT